MKIKKMLFNVFDLLPFANWTLNFFYQDYSESIITRSLKFGQGIGDDK